MDEIGVYKKKKKNYRKMKCQKKDNKVIIDVLATKFELSKSEVLMAYETFHKKYPEGEILKTEFLKENKV